jgi:hypothetical protein
MIARDFNSCVRPLCFSQVATGPLLPRYGVLIEPLEDSLTAPSDSPGAKQSGDSSSSGNVSSLLASIQAKGGKPSSSGASGAAAGAAAAAAPAALPVALRLPGVSQSASVRLQVKAASSGKDLMLCGRRGGLSGVSEAFSGRFACEQRGKYGFVCTAG